MSPLQDRFPGVLDKVGADSTVGRMLGYAETRFWLLTALDILGQEYEGSRLQPLESAREWSDLCQRWRVAVEGTARLVSAGREQNSYVATVLAACSNAFLRIDRPQLRYTELWCNGSLRRVEIGRAVPHALGCACTVFDEAVRSLEEVRNGPDPWERFTKPTQPKTWVGLMSLCGPHVVRIVHGVADSLEEHAGLGHRASVFSWGELGTGTSLLARAILEDVGIDGAPMLAGRFCEEVLLTRPSSSEMVLHAGDVSRWLEKSRGAAGRARGLLLRVRRHERFF